jgi:hypothetical protein
VFQEQPTDAAAALAALPPPQEYETATASTRESIDPVAAARARLGGPVPFGVYMMMLLGTIVGGAVGAIYGAVVLQHVYAWIALTGAAFGEALVASWYARKKLGKPLTSDQRARVGVWSTAATLVPITGALAIAIGAFPKMLWSALAPMREMNPATLGAVWVLSFGALALLRYLLLTLFASTARPARPAKSHA